MSNCECGMTVVEFDAAPYCHRCALTSALARPAA
jgi:hypothetical protein